MDLSRRELIKAQAAAAAAAAANVPLPAEAQNIAHGEELRLKWSKAPCRFCGTGCGVMVAVKDGRVVATHGDMRAEVNRGLNCVKGYFLSKIMYGSDRLTRPLMRMRNGRFAKDGELQPVSWDQAFDTMAAHWKKVLREKGPEAVGMFGSGQWTMFEGYAATKLMRGGFRSNNLDPNARHCMASAAVTFIRTFGSDEPMGCYDDFEHADAFVLWGSNMAEMHPILWTRITDRRLSAEHVRIHTLSTYEHRTTELSDAAVIFKPGSDLAILNYIANHIIRSGAVNREFVERHVNFRLANTDIGYGLRPEHVLEQRAQHANDAQVSQPADFDAYARLMGEYTLDRAHELSGVPKPQLEALAKVYADPKTKVMSLWTMGFNQHVRGVWANHMVYNIHLLTGKISEPGNSPFSLTGQPSACGTAREVGCFSHRLPADMQVTNADHRKTMEEIWKLPSGLLPSKVGYHAVQQDRMLKDGKLNAYWIMCNNNLQTAPNTNNETYPGYRNPENLIVCSDPYPTVTAMAADIVLPTAMWVEKEGAYGNAERRTQILAPARGRAGRGALRPLAAHGVLQALHDRRGLARRDPGPRAGVPRQDPLRRAVPQRPGGQLPGLGPRPRLQQPGIEALRLLRAEGHLGGVHPLRRRPRPRLRALRRLPRGARAALAGGGRQGNALALSGGLRPLCREGVGAPILRQPRQEGEPDRRPLRAAGRGRRTRNTTSGSSPGGCWSTGIPAR